MLVELFTCLLRSSLTELKQRNRDLETSRAIRLSLKILSGPRAIGLLGSMSRASSL
jgi:hypothetical protein